MGPVSQRWVGIYQKKKMKAIQYREVAVLGTTQRHESLCMKCKHWHRMHPQAQWIEELSTECLGQRKKMILEGHIRNVKNLECYPPASQKWILTYRWWGEQTTSKLKKKKKGSVVLIITEIFRCFTIIHVLRLLMKNMLVLSCPPENELPQMK